MTLDRLIGRIALIGGLSLFGYNCDSSSDPASCIKDTDCKGERLCEKNVCVDKTSSNFTNYTCETGAKMYVDLCCGNVILNGEKGCSSKSGYSIYQLVVGDCDSNDPTIEQRHLKFFSCVYPVCKDKYLSNSADRQEAKKKIDFCNATYFN